MRQVQKKQYTIRNLPPGLDEKLRQMKRDLGTSLNEAVLVALKRGAGLAEEAVTYHDLDRLAGSWKEDRAFDDAIREQDQIDPKLWS